MAKYFTQYGDLQNQAASLQNIGKTLASYERELNSIVNAMDGRDSRMATLRTQVRDAATQIPRLSRCLSASGTAASEIGLSYLAAEKSVHGAVAGVKVIGSASQNAVAIATVGAASDISKWTVFTRATMGMAKGIKAGWQDKVTTGAKQLWSSTKNVLSTTGAKNTLKIAGGIASVVALSALTLNPITAPFIIIGGIYALNNIGSGIGGLKTGSEVNYLKTGMVNVLGEKTGGNVYNAGAIIATATTFVGGGKLVSGEMITAGATGASATTVMVKGIKGIVTTSVGFITSSADIGDNIENITGVPTGHLPPAIVDNLNAYEDVKGVYEAPKNAVDVTKIILGLFK
jgi:hypothetical protein